MRKYLVKDDTGIYVAMHVHLGNETVPFENAIQQGAEFFSISPDDTSLDNITDLNAILWDTVKKGTDGKLTFEVDYEIIKTKARNSLPSLTKRQFAFYLKDRGLYPTVKALIEADEDAALEYETTYKIERSSPTVAYMAEKLGLTQDQVDAMWEVALTY